MLTKVSHEPNLCKSTFELHGNFVLNAAVLLTQYVQCISVYIMQPMLLWVSLYSASQGHRGEGGNAVKVKM